MACLTCDHTMKKLFNGGTKVYWCPKCGTLKTEFSSGDCLVSWERPFDSVERYNCFSERVYEER